MSIANAIPQVWAAKLLRALDTRLVYASPAVINRNYQGEIASSGDTVRITTLADVVVSDYTRDTDLASPEALTDAQLNLVIDQQKSYNFAIDDIDLRQSAVTDLEEQAAHRAAYGIAKAVDTFIAGKYTDISTSNTVGSDASPTHSLKENEAYNNLLELAVKLDETDTPDEGNRFCIVPPFLAGALLKDVRFVSYGTQANRANLEQGFMPGANGLIGKVAGFDIYQSNQVPQTSSKKYKVIAGYAGAWSYADQLTETVNYRPERRFAQGYKGLHVYGAKVLRPANLALLTTNNEA